MFAIDDVIMKVVLLEYSELITKGPFYWQGLAEPPGLDHHRVYSMRK